MCDATTGEADRSTLLDNTALSATIDILSDSTAGDVHIRPDVCSILGLVVVFNTSKYLSEVCIAWATAGTIDATTNSTTLNIYSSI